ncbi:hypothetical protein GF391_03505 [Candidatus Uhrbacteria bacterium]|nr:hypothetical protein [Candidatus Uhrbacteria bacterium]
MTDAPKVPTFDSKDVEENKLIAALGYVGILCLIPLLAKKESKFSQEHGKQGLVLLIVWVIGSFVFWFPIIGWLLALGVLIINIIAFVKALMGEFWEIPVVGQYRNKFNI